MVVQDQAEGEALADGSREAGQAGEISAGDRRRRLYLDPDDPPEPVFDHDVYLVAFLVSEVREGVPIIAPARELQKLAENECLQHRSERRPVAAQTIRRDAPQGG